MLMVIATQKISKAKRSGTIRPVSQVVVKQTIRGKYGDIIREGNSVVAPSSFSSMARCAWI
jgi:hypothetical protein